MAAADTSALANNRAHPARSPRIEWVPIGQLRPNPRNARMHSRKQIRGIAASIRKFGFLNPVLVDGDNMVLAGHGRLEAARLECLTHVQIIRFDHLTVGSALVKIGRGPESKMIDPSYGNFIDTICMSMILYGEGRLWVGAEFLDETRNASAAGFEMLQASTSGQLAALSKLAG